MLERASNAPRDSRNRNHDLKSLKHRDQNIVHLHILQLDLFLHLRETRAFYLAPASSNVSRFQRRPKSFQKEWHEDNSRR